MTYTKTQQTALDWAAGKASLEDVVAAIKVGDNPTGEVVPIPPPKTYEQMMTAMDADDSYTAPNMDGWDGIVLLYNTGALNDANYAALYDAS